MAQISYAYTGLFPSKLDIPAAALKVKEMLPINPEPFLRNFMLKFSPEVLVPVNIKIFGTSYDPGMVLVLTKEDCGEVMKVGILRAIAVDKEEVFLGVVSFEAQRSQHGYFVTTKQVNSFEIVNHSQLADYSPLQRIGPADTFRFCLHHYVSSSS